MKRNHNPLLNDVLVKFVIFFLTIPSLNSSAQEPNSPEQLFSDLTRRLPDSIPCLGSFVIYSHGKVVYEKYFHETDRSTVYNVKSITKSVVSALAGIASDRGLLPDLQKPVVSFFPEYATPRAKAGVWYLEEKKYNDSVRSKVTLRDLLTMQTGWDWNDFDGPVWMWINSTDPVRFTMEFLYADTPGTKFRYATPATSLFGAVLEKCVKSDLLTFGEKYLFKPTGMKVRRWDKDPMGRYVGGSEMFMTTGDLLKFGLLFLKKGKVNGKQVISEKWVLESTSEQATLNFWDILPGANGYGYYWWRRKTNGLQAWIASGAGGQIVTVIPQSDMVVVANCLPYPNRGREEIHRIHLFVDEVTRVLR